MYDIYALISCSLFAFNRTRWTDYVHVRAQGLEPAIWEYAEVMIGDDDAGTPESVTDTDSWTTADWQDEFERRADDEYEWERYLASVDEDLLEHLAAAAG
jgi:hypothetical protein